MYMYKYKYNLTIGLGIEYIFINKFNSTIKTIALSSCIIIDENCANTTWIFAYNIKAYIYTNCWHNKWWNKCGVLIIVSEHMSLLILVL